MKVNIPLIHPFTWSHAYADECNDVHPVGLMLRQKQIFCQCRLVRLQKQPPSFILTATFLRRLALLQLHISRNPLTSKCYTMFRIGVFLLTGNVGFSSVHASLLSLENCWLFGLFTTQR